MSTLDDAPPRPTPPVAAAAVRARPAAAWRGPGGRLRAPGVAGRVAVAALVLAVAGAVDPWGFRPFTTLRWPVVAVAAAVAAATLAGRRTGRARGVLAGWAVFLALVGVATMVALDPLTALVGHPRRHLGLAGWLACGLACLAGANLPAATLRRTVGRAAVVAGLVTGAGAVADVVGWEPFGVAFAGGRAGGLLGQPLYLGAVAVLLAPVAAGVAADARAPARWRRAAAVAAAGSLAATVASGTRGAWLGALVAAAMAWPAVRPWVAAHRRAVGAAAVLVALAVAGPLAGRLTSLADPDAAGGRGRLDEWALAVDVVAEHPLTGVGPDGYRIAAPAHVTEGYARRHGRDEVVDRAHSGPLDVAASAGLPAAAAYVGLLGAAVVVGVRALRRGACPVAAGAGAGVVAWVVQQGVGFPIAEVDPLAWLLVGALAATTPPPARVAEVGEVLPPSRLARVGEVLLSAVPADDGAVGGLPASPSVARLLRGPGARRRAAVRLGGAAAAGRAWGTRLAAGASRGGRAGWVGVGVRGVAGVVGVVVAVGGVLAVAGDRDLAVAEERAARGDPSAVFVADRATRHRPDDVDAWYVSARVAAGSSASLLAVDAGLDRVEAGLRRLPDDPALLDLHEELLVRRALRSQLPDDLDAARAAAEGRIAADPAHPAHHRRLGLVLAAAGEDDDATRALRRALDLDPDDAAARAALATLEARPSAPAAGDAEGAS